jgi:hypothetical protein
MKANKRCFYHLFITKLEMNILVFVPRIRGNRRSAHFFTIIFLHFQSKTTKNTEGVAQELPQYFLTKQHTFQVKPTFNKAFQL